MPCAKSAMITSQRKMITSQVQFQIAKFKFRQYQNTTFFAISPNLMPAKFSRYTVFGKSIPTAAYQTFRLHTTVQN